ncbi:MAG: 4-alpha-glucanotransferase, partial [Muribaculaceae bacterium]|nr:4-alpha-glucanotransferase [Muribaculaceae bacterium]
HTFRRARHAEIYRIFDRWSDIPTDKPLYSSAFTNCINRRVNPDRKTTLHEGMLSIRVSAPSIRSDEVLAITGEQDALGNWDPARAIIMNDSGFPEWEISLRHKDITFPFQYKFLILSRKTHQLVAWENHDNRIFANAPQASDEVIVESGLRFISPMAPWRGAGTAIPVFSIRTDDDYGVGDFYDLKKLIDWAAATAQTFIQILPINDTTMTYTWMDSYPYNANSTFALHPMYLRISELGTLDNSDLQAYYDKLGKELNALPQIDYERVNHAKTDFTKALFAQHGAKVIASDEYKTFVKQNEYWLTPYAAFCVLRDRYNTPDFRLWGEYSIYDPDRIAHLCDEYKNETDYVRYIQFY